MAEEQQTFTGYFHTASRKFKQLIGVLPDGSAIWGGPYTIPQFLSGLGFGILAFATRQLWSVNFIVDLVVIVGGAFGVAVGLGKLPSPRRSVAGMIQSFFDLLLRPKEGRYRGMKITATIPKAAEIGKKQAKTKTPKKKTAGSEASAEHQTPQEQQPEIVSGTDRLKADLHLI